MNEDGSADWCLAQREIDQIAYTDLVSAFGALPRPVGNALLDALSSEGVFASESDTPFVFVSIWA